MQRYVWLSAALLITLSAILFAQPGFTDVFPPEEFAARRAKVMAQIGDGVAVAPCATERPGEQSLRQNNQFFYLTGVVEPRAILVIDGKVKRSTLYLYGGAERRARMFGSAMVPGDAAVAATGIEAALPREEFAKAVETFAREGRVIYTPFRPETLGNASSSDAAASAKATKEDPWDGRPSREEVFIQKLKALAPEIDVRNLDPILDAMRAFKSPREIAVIREATRIAGLARDGKQRGKKRKDDKEGFPARFGIYSHFSFSHAFFTWRHKSATESRAGADAPGYEKPAWRGGG